MSTNVVWVLLVVVPLAIIVLLAAWHIVARRPDLGVPGKAAWLAAIFLIPWIGVLVYVMFRPPGLAAGKATASQDTASPLMRSVADLIGAHQTGEITDAEFATRKAELFGI
ncbi:MAG: hypothetical protein BMS9Abin07_0976 [Acidimicrobiia bacterium]|nr:MAG: hypothetical protein BMS9Abin07_0976 [Acidimicrobiia bacterium]